MTRSHDSRASSWGLFVVGGCSRRATVATRRETVPIPFIPSGVPAPRRHPLLRRPAPAALLQLAVPSLPMPQSSPDAPRSLPHMHDPSPMHSRVAATPSHIRTEPPPPPPPLDPRPSRGVFFSPSVTDVRCVAHCQHGACQFLLSASLPAQRGRCLCDCQCAV